MQPKRLKLFYPRRKSFSTNAFIYRLNGIDGGYSPEGTFGSVLDTEIFTASYGQPANFVKVTNNIGVLLWLKNTGYPYLRSVSMTDGGIFALVDEMGDSGEFGSSSMRDSYLILRSPNILLMYHGNPTAQCYLRTIGCDDNGTFDAGTIDNLLLNTASNTNYRQFLDRPHGNDIIIARPPSGAGGYSTWTADVDSSGNIGAAYIDRMLNTYNYAGFRPSRRINETDYFVCADFSPTLVGVATFTCDSSGNLPASDVDSWATGLSGTEAWGDIMTVGSDGTVVLVSEVSNYPWLRTFAVNPSTGAITKSWIDTQQVSSDTGCQGVRLIKINDNKFVTLYSRTGYAFEMKSWEIEDDGTITNTPIDTTNVVSNQLGAPQMVYLKKNIWVVLGTYGTYNCALRSIEID